VRPLVSILIPSFNAEPWIRQTLESAISQEYPHKEVIIVDDGSTDRTLEIARTFESPSVLVIAQPNAGGPAARNKALVHAQGEYIQWLDHDDLLAPGKISSQINEWERVQSDNMLFSCPFAMFYYRWEKAKLSQSRLYQNLTPSDYFFIKFSDDTYFQPSCWLVSRKLSDLAGPWWELRSPDDDGEYFCRVVAASKGIHFVPEARCHWRVTHQGFNQAWKRSRVHLHALFESTVRSIAHYRKLEDTERSRAACVAFLQNRLIYFYPESPDIVTQMSALAEELGGALSPPTLKWRYRYIKAAFGWSAAKRFRFSLGSLKQSAERSWDQLMFNLGSRSKT
jgi:glycosyltransferase involved in cell wall biosynthesis